MSNISNVAAAGANSDLFITIGHFFSLSSRLQSGVPPGGIGVNWRSRRNALGVHLPVRRLEQALRPWVSHTAFPRRTAQTQFVAAGGLISYGTNWPEGFPASR